MKRHSTLAAVGGIAIMAAASMTLGSQEVTAADHTDAPGAMADPAADIADFYAWHTDNDTIVAVITFAALQGPGADAVYDRDVLYSVHIDNTALLANAATPADPFTSTNDNQSDLDINIRFGVNAFDEWGVQIEGLPGSDETFQGLVGEDLDGGGGTRAHAGTFDDPFFFDATGFQTTLANIADNDDTNDLAGFSSLADFPNSITPATDALMGTNVHGIVLEFDAPTALAKNEDGILQVWATTSRISE